MLNNWSIWEKTTASIRALNAAKHPPTGGWPDFLLQRHPSPLDAENYISGRACDHYRRFEQDFDIARSLGHNAHRFSVEWSRIEPEEGHFDEEEIEHYREVISALRERGLEPFMTLWHFTLPLWLDRRGGWMYRKTPYFFARFAARAAEAFGGNVIFFITLNEPEVYAQNAYLRGIWPPAKKNPISAIWATRHFIEGHKLAYARIKERRPQAQVGIAKNNTFFEGRFAGIFKYLRNDYFLNHIKDTQDFTGINYYSHNRIRGFRMNQNDNKEVSDVGWEVYPKGLYYVLKDAAKYGKPIYILENGIADARDAYRARFIRDHLTEVANAMAEGVDVRGYFHWSLMDNMELEKGFWPRFGLVEIDYKTQRRIIRQSAWEYKDIIDKSGK